MGMQVELNTEPIDSLIQRLRGANKIVRSAAFQVKANAQTAIKTGPKSGRFYAKSSIRRNYKTGGKRANQLKGIGLRGKANEETGKTSFVIGAKLHQASAKGEAPASDVGKLANSIGSPIKTSDCTYEVPVGAEYGYVLEVELDRPFLEPAVNKVAPVFEAALQKMITG